MAAIFDDISVEELSDYTDYEFFNEILNEEDKSLINNYFMLSYGTSNGLVPAGIFVIANFEDSKGQIITEEEAAYFNGNVRFKQIEITEDGKYQLKEQGPSAIMPYKSFIDVCKDVETNNKELEPFMENDGLSPEVVGTVESVVSESLVTKPHNYENIDFNLRGTSLQDAGAILINNNLVETGLNYTIFPFENKYYKYAQVICDYCHELPVDNKPLR